MPENRHLVSFLFALYLSLMPFRAVWPGIPDWSMVIATSSLGREERTLIVSLQKEGLNDDFSGRRSESDDTLYSGFTPNHEISLLRLQGNGYIEEIYLQNQGDDRIPIIPGNIFSRNDAYNHNLWNRQSRHALLVIPSLNQQTSESNLSGFNNDDFLTFSFSHADLENINTTDCGNNALHFLRHDDQWTLFIELYRLTGQCLIDLPESTPVSLISAELTGHSKTVKLPLEATPPNTTEQATEKHPAPTPSTEAVAQDSALVVYLSPATIGDQLYDQHYERLYTTRIWLMARSQADSNTELNNHKLVLSENFKFNAPPDQDYLKSNHRKTKKTTLEEIIHLSKRLDKEVEKLLNLSKTEIKNLQNLLPVIEITRQLVSKTDEIKMLIISYNKRTNNKKFSHKQKIDGIYRTILSAINFLSLFVAGSNYEDISTKITVNGEKTTIIDVIAECYSALPSLLTEDKTSLHRFKSINDQVNTILTDTISAIEMQPDNENFKKRSHSALAKIFKTIISSRWYFQNDEFTYNLFSIAGQVFINESNVELMFLLAQHLSEHYKKDTYNDYDQDNKKFFTDDLIDLIWIKFKELMPRIDIPTKQLYDFEQQARDIDIDTNGWIGHINSYEQAKQNLRSHKEAILDQRARENADNLIKEMEEMYQKKQEKLRKARQARSQKAAKPTIKTDLAEPAKTLSDTAVTETTPDPKPLPDKPEPWEQLYQKGIHELTSHNFEAARSFFREALNAQPGLLNEATIYSAIADTYFVPGETQQKAIRQAFAQTQVLLNKMRHATDQPIDKQQLNSLSEQFLSLAEKLDKPIKHSAENHLKSIQCLEAVPAQQLEEVSAKDHASGLLAILKQEGEQLEQIKKLISESIDTLLTTYDLRRDFILNMSSGTPPKAKTSKLPSEEARYKQSLLSLKNQLTPGHRTEKPQTTTKTQRSQNKQIISLEPDTCFSSFFQALEQADKIRQNWKLETHSAVAEVDSHTQKINRELIQTFYKENPGFSFKKLRKNLKGKLIKSSNIQSLLKQLGNNESFSYNAQPQPDDLLYHFLTSHNRAVADVDADHFCMFNAITLWLSHNREATSAFPGIQNGQDLFLALAPYAIELAAQHPRNSGLNAIAAAFYVKEPNIQLWGSNDMLHTLISPILGIPVMVFDNGQIEASRVINAMLYDNSGSVHVIEQDQIFNVMTSNTLVLVHSSNHWMTVLPTPERHGPAETLPDPAERLLNAPLLLNHQESVPVGTSAIIHSH
ncbi:hypothetical protein [Endozoicomonas euniceicola]|uniref:OTU domain-containing protein n=1 Tax=Endozoicomonas euniceicola TaxID=1234143 RepID=A0ABY6GQJ1_9GAMM|nr:hypothetical protein [Endozoicomonas euniceicola]UYM15022.1 hypothetical protein NX720_19430 [Endozoicomonas euniceicola]